MSLASDRLFILNGPNLNLLGKREPEIYGYQTLEDIAMLCEERAKLYGLQVSFHQSNYEGELIDWIHDAREQAAGLILNAGAYTHTSIALHDALKALAIPVLEVHLSNIHAREEFRAHSYVAKAAKGMICGLGAQGYELAIDALARLLDRD